MKLEVLWKEYQSSLKRFLHSKVSCPDDVDDLLQEIMLKIHSNLKSVKDTSKIHSWIFQIAHNTIIDYYRQKHRQSAVLSEELWYQEFDKADTMKELALCLLPFIQQLPRKDADLLVAIEIEKIPQKLYAEKMGLNYSTLKSRVKQSRKKLYSLFQSCCEFSVDTQGNIMEYAPRRADCARC